MHINPRVAVVSVATFVLVTLIALAVAGDVARVCTPPNLSIPPCEGICAVSQECGPSTAAAAVSVLAGLLLGVATGWLVYRRERLV